MKGLAVFLVVALLLIGALYAMGVFSGKSWWEPNSSNQPATGDVMTENKSVETQGARSALVELRMGAGKVTVQGGASDLMDATFSYNVSAWKPIVDYVVTNDQGSLLVREPNGTYSFSSKYRYEWNIRLNSSTPIDLEVKTGAGNASLDLSDMMVRTLTVDAGAASASIKGSPKAMTSMDVKTGVGSVNIDLTGNWKNSATINVNGGVGSIKLIVPRNVAVTVDAKRGLGSISASGFTRDGDTYRNAAYGSGAVTLSIDLNVGVGSVTITEE
jgi:N-terminal domain of toast_rack, DUF2154/Cell wall-active antibiotics response 4TMS YvqF